MIPEKFKGLFRKMRELKIEDKDIIDISEPGLIRIPCKILFIAQNCGIPRPHLIPSDAKLLDKNISDEDFHDAYAESQRSWKFHDFIINFCKWEEASILNIMHFPTKNNQHPSLKAVEICESLLREAINLINPRYII